MNNIYLCKSDMSMLGTMSGLQRDTCELKKNAIDLWELTFDVNRYVEVNGVLKESNFYDSIDEMMKLYLEDELTQAYFIIDEEPSIRGEGNQEVKSVTAHSIECELSNKILSNFKINCGTKDSQEYLVTDQDGNFNNIDAYTNLPIEYISLVNYNNHQLSLMHLALQNTDWKVKDNIDGNICAIKKNFESSDSVYSFLMKTVSPALKVIFEFDRKHKEINIVKAEDFGEDTGIFVTMRNLMNSFDITSSSSDGIITKIIPKGNNNLGIEYVNFGEDYIINLDYFMNELNEYGDYKYITKEIHDKYTQWKFFRDEEQIIVSKQLMTRREAYRLYSKNYNESLLTISELTNRNLNDGCKIDYKTYSLEELKTSLQAYENALQALIVLYKNEYNKTEIDDFIKGTPYWYDYYAYKEIIIPQVTEALKMYCKTDTSGNLCYDENGEIIELEFGNPKYYKDESIINEINAYEYEWSLYGLDELQAKRKAWLECANVLHEDCFIIGDVETDPVYMKPTDSYWEGLSKENKNKFTTKEAFFNKLNQYLDYMANWERENSITGTVCKGIVRECEDAISKIEARIEATQGLQESYNILRKELADSVAMNKFFTETELIAIKTLLIQQDYNNEHISTTNLDDIVSTIEIQEELYQDATNELVELSQPQYNFSTELNNLYSLKEFKAYRKPFSIGNFIRVGFEIHEHLKDNRFIKLRLISITYNPLEISENISVEFSTMTKSLNTISDLAFLLDESSSTSSGGGSSSSSSSGTYGDNDADIQISNNMLNALLKNESFGTTVSDVILNSLKSNKGNFNTLFANSGAFDALETGFIKVSGDCLFDKIKSKNWNGTDDDLLSNTEGTIIDLTEGNFSFAGGNLKYDEDMLTVKGNIIADSFILSDGVVVAGLTSENLEDCKQIVLKDNPIGEKTDEHNSGYLNISNDGVLEADNAVIHGTVYATDGEFTGTLKGCDGEFTGTLKGCDGEFTGSINVNNNFKLNSNGDVELGGIKNNIYLNGDGYSYIDKQTNNIISLGYKHDTIDTVAVSNLSHNEQIGLLISCETPLTEANNGIKYEGDNKLELDYDRIRIYDKSKTYYSEEEVYTTETMTTIANGSILIQEYGESTIDDPGIPISGLNTIISIDRDNFICPVLCKDSTTSGHQLRVDDDGYVWKYSSSSKRYKDNITTTISDNLDPHKLYDIDVVQFNYKDGYLSEDDQRRDKDIIGFIAEDIYEKYPIACNLDKEGLPEVPEHNLLIAPMLKLIQEQHEDIKNLQKEIKELKDKITEV